MPDENVVFKQISAGRLLYGLAEDGTVWRYVAANEGRNRYAFWTRLTSRGAKGGKQKEEEQEERQIDALAGKVAERLREQPQT